MNVFAPFLMNRRASAADRIRSGGAEASVFIGGYHEFSVAGCDIEGNFSVLRRDDLGRAAVSVASVNGKVRRAAL